MSTFMRRVLIAALLLVPAILIAQQLVGQGDGSTPAARLGDRVITMKEVDEAWKKAEPVEFLRATQLTYDGRREAIDRIIADILVERAAKTKGVSVEQYMREEIAKRTKAVTDAEAEAFYNTNKGRMQGKPLTEMQPVIREYLERQQSTQARERLVADLKKDAPALKVLIDPPRQPVEIAQHDPVRGGDAAPVTIVEFSDYQ